MEPNSAEVSESCMTPNISHLSKPKKELSYDHMTLFDLLNKYGSQLTPFRRGKENQKSPQTVPSTSSHHVLSAESISRIARMKWRKESQRVDGHDCDMKDIELGLNLSLAAEKISNQDYDHAEILLSSCKLLSVPAATPIQKVVHYFSEALREKIDIDKGQIDLERKIIHLEEVPNFVQPDKVAYEVGLPFGQITGFVATQAILEHVGSAASIHIIDFRVRSGTHWPIVMQAIANRKNCPIQLLKLTAVGTSKDKLEDTGRWLSNFSVSMNLPFSFKVVLSKLEDLKADLFELEDAEVVVLYMDVQLWTLLSRPNHLETFMGVVNNLNPSLMMVAELEANTNTSPFLPRFYESLFLASALFDCFETCLQTDCQIRKITEDVIIPIAIRDVIACEDEERIHRHERIEFWREMFSRFGLLELELSDSALFQASLVLKSCASWRPCTISMNGKSMSIQWKGTPIKSISFWKFKCD